jgi:hypothetical protein
MRMLLRMLLRALVLRMCAVTQHGAANSAAHVLFIEKTIKPMRRIGVHWKNNQT